MSTYNLCESSNMENTKVGHAKTQKRVETTLKNLSPSLLSHPVTIICISRQWRLLCAYAKTCLLMSTCEEIRKKLCQSTKFINCARMSSHSTVVTFDRPVPETALGTYRFVPELSKSFLSSFSLLWRSLKRSQCEYI